MRASPPTVPRRRTGPRPPGPSASWYAALFALVGGLLWGLARLATPADSPLAMRIRYADTAPQLRSGADAPWQAVDLDHTPQVGDSLKTTDGMCTALVLGGGSSVRLYIDTALTIDDASRTRGELGLHLTEGRIWIDAAPSLKVRVVTPKGEIEVSGGATEVRVARDRVEALTWRGAARCAGQPLPEAHRVVLGAPPSRGLPRPDAWVSWNRRVESAPLASHPLPALASPAAVAARPAEAPARPETTAATPARVRPPRASAERRPVQPTRAAEAPPPPPSPAATPLAARLEDEQITVGPNDPIEKQVADLGSQELARSFGRLNTDPAMNARVERIGQRIAAQCPRASMKWTFRVLDSAVPNAVTVGYGRVYVTRGLLAMVDDEELAGALGHEIAHACLRHSERLFDQQQEALGYARKAQEARRQALAARAQNDVGAFNEQARIFNENLRKATEALERAQSPSERWDAEYQADRYGMLYVHNAGFRPIGLVDSLEKLRKAAGTESEAAVTGGSTHPPLNERVEIARKVYASYFPGR